MARGDAVVVGARATARAVEARLADGASGRIAVTARGAQKARRITVIAERAFAVGAAARRTFESGIAANGALRATAVVDAAWSTRACGSTVQDCADRVVGQFAEVLGGAGASFTTTRATRARAADLRGRTARVGAATHPADPIFGVAHGTECAVGIGATAGAACPSFADFAVGTARVGATAQGAHARVRFASLAQRAVVVAAAGRATAQCFADLVTCAGLGGATAGHAFVGQADLARAAVRVGLTADGAAVGADIAVGAGRTAERDTRWREGFALAARADLVGAAGRTTSSAVFACGVEVDAVLAADRQWWAACVRAVAETLGARSGSVLTAVLTRGVRAQRDARIRVRARGRWGARARSENGARQTEPASNQAWSEHRFG